MRRAMPLMLLLGSLAAPRAAVAQSFFVQGAQLYEGDVGVGECVTVAVRAAPTPSGRVAVRFDGGALRVRAELDLTQARLQAGVGVDVVLAGGAFATRMREGTWAPVVAMAGREVRLALPEGSPARSATLARGVRGAAGKPTGSPWGASARAPLDDGDLHCAGLALSASAGATPTWTPRDEDARRIVRTTNGVDTIEVDVRGFVFTGYRPHGAACAPTDFGGLGLSGTGGAGDGWAMGRVVTLPSGTELFSSATATRSFATLHVVTYGIEPLDGPTARGCHGGVCERFPPEPHGPAKWIVEVQDPSGAGFLFEAWVHTPAEHLADAPPDHGGFGLVGGVEPSWPTLASVTR